MKTEEQKIHSNQSELRQDIVTGDWVVIATGRAKRPDTFASQERIHSDTHDDPFVDPEITREEDDILVYRQGDGDWSLRVFPNKYPAFSSTEPVKDLSQGPYFAMTGFGYHELFVTRDPVKPLALLETWQGAELFDAYQERYLSLMNKPDINYIQIFHNHGKEAGASIEHPHSQLMALPAISPYINLELFGAERYYKSNHQNVYAVMLKAEQTMKKRILFENEHFVVFCPFASRVAFEVRVIGKRANPYFERITDEEKFALAEAMQKALSSIYHGLNDPAYNFYIHTAPCDGKDYQHYQWHIEILPRTSVWAGFELSTGIEISTIEPEKAAEYLRENIEKK